MRQLLCLSPSSAFLTGADAAAAGDVVLGGLADATLRLSYEVDSLGPCARQPAS